MRQPYTSAHLNTTPHIQLTRPINESIHHPMIPTKKSQCREYLGKKKERTNERKKERNKIDDVYFLVTPAFVFWPFAPA